MHLYDQITTIPIYEASLILLNMVCGAIILGESAAYTFLEMLLLIFSALISIAGVIIIARKDSSQTTSNKADQEKYIELQN